MATKTKTIECWKIDDPNLPEKVKDKILAKHVDINVDHDWWDPIDNYFPSFCKNVEVSGFDWDQGYIDFSCDFDYAKILAAYKVAKRGHCDIFANSGVLRRNGYTYHAKAGTLTLWGLKFRLICSVGSGRHESTDIQIHLVDYPRDCSRLGDYADAGDLWADLRGIPVNRADLLDLFAELDRFLDWVRGQFHPLSNLREGYDYLTGEEAIIETLRANEFDFDENGDIV